MYEQKILFEVRGVCGRWGCDLEWIDFAQMCIRR